MFYAIVNIIMEWQHTSRRSPSRRHRTHRSYAAVRDTSSLSCSWDSSRDKPLHLALTHRTVEIYQQLLILFVHNNYTIQRTVIQDLASIDSDYGSSDQPKKWEHEEQELTIYTWKKTVRTLFEATREREPWWWPILARWSGHWNPSPVSTWMGDRQGRLSQ